MHKIPYIRGPRYEDFLIGLFYDDVAQPDDLIRDNFTRKRPRQRAVVNTVMNLRVP